MRSHIPIKLFKVPNEKNFNQMNFEEFQLKKNPMILLSKRCYLNLYDNDFYFGTSGASTHKFWIRNSDYISISFASIRPIHATDWYLMKDFSFERNHFHFNADIPTEIVFIYYENEFKDKDAKAFFLTGGESENPISIIMEDVPQFKNSMFFLTHDSYLNLIKNTSTLSSYKGITRLIWAPDQEYSGCSIMLNSINDKSLYFIENMNFADFSKIFSVSGLPDTLYFII